MVKINSIKNIVMVTSIPKSGTHLMSKLLENLGLRNSETFVLKSNLIIKEVKDEFGSNRNCGYYFLEGHPYYYNNKINIDFNAFIKILSPGDFFLSHFTPAVFPYYLTSSVKVICMKRNIIKTLISGFKTEILIYQRSKNTNYLREKSLDFISVIEKDMKNVMEQKNIQEKFYKYLENCTSERCGLLIDLLYWRNYKNALFVDYEDLISKDNSVLLTQKIASFLGIKIAHSQVIDLLHKTLEDKNPTKTPDRSAEIFQDLVWDEKCQQIFENNMLHKIQEEYDAITH